MSKPFLTAHWSNLCLVTYAVDPAVLEPRVPDELELDTLEGRAFVSLVAFDFLDTRVKGIAWPGFRDFPEVNLRFYVRHGERRGVMFIREFVPQSIVALIARRLYNEPYVAAPMKSWVEQTPEHIDVEPRWSWQSELQRVLVEGARPGARPAEDSTAHFFKEHQWGFGVDHDGRTLIYEVQHPVWETYPVRNMRVDVDFGHLYGEEFASLENATPYSTILAAGSDIRVFPKRYFSQLP